MTARQEQVLRILRKHQKPLGPTEIGLEMGFAYNVASSRVSASLKRLVADGLVERVTTTWRVKYRSVT